MTQAYLHLFYSVILIFCAGWLGYLYGAKVKSKAEHIVEIVKR